MKTLVQCALYCLFSMAAGPLLIAATPAADPLDTVEKAASDWVKIRAETSRLETEWSTQRDITDATVRALEQRAKTSEDKRAGITEKNIKERSDLDSVDAKNRLAATALVDAEVSLKKTQAMVLEMRPTLPPRLSLALELPYKTLANPELSPGDRMQFTMTILNRCLQFNRAVSYGEEPVKIDGSGEPKILEVIYWGLNRAYALDRQSSNAWVGAPSPQGWHWEPRPESVPAIERLIAVYNDKAEPAFVEVPARIAHVGPDNNSAAHE